MFLAAWSTSGWSADEPAMVSLPEREPEAAGAAPVWPPEAAGKGVEGLSEVPIEAHRALRWDRTVR